MNKTTFWFVYLLLGMVGAAIFYFLFEKSTVSWMLPFSFFLMGVWIILYILSDRINRTKTR
ncbi:hypothetical protein ACQCVE_14590 [Metabacillus sp. 113a]|uniref:hypothetical protein n=1 Tax=Metabacillus sp. 113a TaxID=3404706 RepID=UPI003CF84255